MSVVPVSAKPDDAAPPRAASQRNNVYAFPAGQTHQRFAALRDVPPLSWRELHKRAVEPNGYYDPIWATQVSQNARLYRDALALLAWNGSQLVGLMPVQWSSATLHIPGPMLVGWNGYATLCVPTLDRDRPENAASELLKSARQAGARALLLPGIATEGRAFAALEAALRKEDLHADILRSYRRAALDATGDADATLREALGAKKLKELRRQRHRLEDEGPLVFSVATEPAQVTIDLEKFLALEASGWKGARGTALGRDDGDCAFIRNAAPALAARGGLEIVSLSRNGAALASGIILRDGKHAYFFKIAVDESAARSSPGMQLALDVTRHLCSDPNIELADSSSDFANSMLQSMWRDRVEISDVFIALKPHDPIASGLRLLVQARYRAIDLARAARRLIRR